MTVKIRASARDSIIRALSAGVVPTQGIQHIQVGRQNELTSIVRSIDATSDGAAMFKLVIGEYGSGKTFFLHLVRQLALEKRFVTIHADLSPERRLVASNGQARALYTELINNMATRGRPNGGALNAIVEGFAGKVMAEAEKDGVPTEAIIGSKLAPLQNMVAGWDFAKVLCMFCKGHDEGNDQLKLNAVRWLKGEYSTRIEARADLGVRTIIDDKQLYDAIKLMNQFLVLADHAGLIVLLDEAVNLYKISNAVARQANYEQLMRMLNDTLQTGAGSQNLGVVIGCTPDTVFDARRGMYSYEALSSRLAPNKFAQLHNLTDHNQPIINLKNLEQEDLFLLMKRIRNVFASGNDDDHLIPDAGIEAFMDRCFNTVGADYYRTPRETVRSFVSLLSMLDQYPEKTWEEFVGELEIGADAGAAELTGSADDELAEFTL